MNWSFDQSQGNYDINKEIRIKTSILRSDLCDFSDAYILVTGNITIVKKTFTANNIEAPNNNVFNEKKLVFKNNAPFISCITKINGIKSDNAEDLDVVMLMYNLLEYSKNYKKTTGSLWNSYRDEPNSSTDNNNIAHSILSSKSFDYKANFISNVTNNNLTKNDVKIVIPLKSSCYFVKRKWHKAFRKITIWI